MSSVPIKRGVPQPADRPAGASAPAVQAQGASGASPAAQIAGTAMASSVDVIVVLGRGSRCDSLAYELALDGYRTLRATSPRALRGLSASRRIDLIVFTASSRPAARLHALRVLRAFAAGADDVIRSPFVYTELLARVQALMRRGVLSSAGVIQCGPLRIDTNAHAASFASAPLALRRLEYALLAHLARDPGRVHSKGELLRELWGYQTGGVTRTVDTHVCRLRRALALAGAHGWLVAVRGVGYRLAPDGHGELRLLERRERA